MPDAEQYDAKFGEVYRGIDGEGKLESIIVMVIGHDVPGAMLKDYSVVYLSEHTGTMLNDLDKWCLFKRHWRRVDE